MDQNAAVASHHDLGALENILRWLLHVMQLHFYVMNNVAKYEALINGLCIAAEHFSQF
jgi:hypothetical protein